VERQLVEGGREAEDRVIEAEPTKRCDVLLKHLIPLFVERGVGREGAGEGETHEIALGVDAGKVDLLHRCVVPQRVVVDDLSQSLCTTRTRTRTNRSALAPLPQKERERERDGVEELTPRKLAMSSRFWSTLSKDLN
jgi:hypothetical protein